MEKKKGKGKYLQWLEPDQLEQVANWAAKGCTDAEIAHNMGVHRSTLIRWKEAHRDIRDAVKRGRMLSIACIENMAFKVAMGQAEEEAAVKVRAADGSERVEVVRRKVAPNASMLMFLLKNRAGYRSEPETTVNVETAPRFYFDREELERG